MSANPERDEPGARANLKFVIKNLGKFSFGGRVPGSESRSLLDIPRRALDVAAPVVILWVGFKAGLPWWAALSLAAFEMVINGATRCLETRRVTRHGVDTGPQPQSPQSPELPQPPEAPNLESAETKPEQSTKRS